MRLCILLLAAATAQANPIVIKAARVIYRNAAVVVDGAKIVRIDEHPQRADRDLGDRTWRPCRLGRNGPRQLERAELDGPPPAVHLACRGVGRRLRISARY